MEKIFVCSHIYHGVLGGALALDDKSVTYSTGKLTVDESHRKIIMKYDDIDRIIWIKGMLPVASFVMKDKSVNKFLIFNKTGFLKAYESANSGRKTYKTDDFIAESESEHVLNRHDFFKKEGEVILTRDSLSMGDDCYAPHEYVQEYYAGERLSDLLPAIAEYLPYMKNIVWVVRSDDGLLGYIHSQEEGFYLIELAAKDIHVKDLNDKEIFCRHYYQSSYELRDMIEKYSSLLEAVKAYMAEK